MWIGEGEGGGFTEGRVHDFQQGEGLGPFCKWADAAVEVGGADEGEEEEDAAEDGGPEDGGDEVVGYEVVLLVLGVGAAIGGGAGVHCRGVREWWGEGGGRGKD